MDLADVAAKVEQSEGLASKLENEISEWNPKSKLCRRDEELDQIQGLLD
jgi:hypothetical protein